MQHYYVHDLNCQFQPVLCHITCQSHHPPSESIAPLLLLVISSQDASEPMWPAASAQARNGQHARGPFSWPGQSSWKELNRLRVYIYIYIHPSMGQSIYLSISGSLGMLKNDRWVPAWISVAPGAGASAFRGAHFVGISHVGLGEVIFSGWWLSHPSEKYESQLGG